MKKIRVLHISTAHPAQDPRIVFKQCPALAELYDVYCALPRADTTRSGTIQFIRLPYFSRVIWRALFASPYALLRGLWIRPKLVHVYIPEFLPFAFVFQLLGAKVIYEVQENLYKKMHFKTLNRGRLLEKAFYKIDQFARKHCYLIFTEHAYLSTYTRLTKPYEVIYNYPLPSFLEPFGVPYRPHPKQPSFFYIGLLSFERAFDTLVDALVQLKTSYPEFVVHLFGNRTFTDDDLARLPQFDNVKTNLQFYGYTDQREAFRYAAGATAGLALLKPVGDYPDSYTTKLFEYMALGLPVITSNFPLYKQVVERHRCGLCVSPNDPAQITDALRYLIEHPDEARSMGQRGREAVEQYFSWTQEAKKLLSFYELVLR